MTSSNTFWEVDDQAIDSFTNDFKGISGFTDFEFKYNWRNYKEIESYLKRLMYSSYARNKEIRPYLPQLIHYMEDFFAQCIKDGFISKTNINTILERLKDEKNGLRALKPLLDKGKYGRSVDDVVEINLSIGRHANSPLLDPDDLLRVYLYHEVGHKILHIHSNEKTINNYVQALDGMLEEKGVFNFETTYKDELVSDGFLMIEECLAQELAERLTYEITGKKRPKIKTRNEIANIQGGVPEIVLVPNNYDFYGLFQEPTIEFGKTLRGCHGRETTDEEILGNMIKKALYTNFDEQVIREYNHGNGELFKDLFLTLRTMGFVLRQKYASFGVGTPIKGVTTEHCLNVIKTITGRNEDMREFPSFGFPKIEYSKYIPQQPSQPQP